MVQTPIILALDTATGPCSVAVWKDGRVAAYLADKGPLTQSARLLPMVEEAMHKAGVNYKDLTALAATVGPGSFTSIRVGLAAARGICFAAGIPGLGFTTLEVLAYAALAHLREEAQALAILNAGKGEYYWQRFCVSPEFKALSEPEVGPLNEAVSGAPALVAGNAEIADKGLIKTAVTFPQADALAELATRYVALAQPLKPFYIRPPDAKPMAVDR
jgi:tRNA threonylcarbamoyladenosine biosynthesis protein TsaB